MNNELGGFVIKFSTEGIPELKDAFKEMQKQMSEMNANFKKSAPTADAFFGKFNSWIKKAGLLAGAIAGIGKAIKDAFTIGDDIINLNVVAEMAGVKAEDVEALAIATAPYMGGKKDINAAGQFYRNILETQTEWWRGKYANEVVDVMSRAGVKGLRPDSSVEEWMSGLTQALSYYKGDNSRYAKGARNLFGKAFGLTDEQILFFQGGQERVNNMLQYGRSHLTLSGEEKFQEAMENAKAKMEFKESWQKLTIELMPLVRLLLQGMTLVVELLRPIAAAIGRIATWIGEKLEKPVEYLKAMFKGDISSTDATVAMSEELKDIASDPNTSHFKKRMSELTAWVSDFVLGKVAERNGKTVKETIANANKNLDAARIAGKLSTSSITNDNKVNVSVGTINVETKDKTTTGDDVIDGIRRSIGNGGLNPSTLNTGVKWG